jgi:hypothetical protein
MTMTTLSKPRRRARELKPVTVTLDGLNYDRSSGTGYVFLNCRMYVLEAIRDVGRTTGLSFLPLDEIGRKHDVDFTAEFGWRCDCEDATYNPQRPGGCKHVVSCRLMAQQLKGGS